MVFINNQTKHHLPKRRLLKITKSFLKERGRKEQEVSLVFVEPEFMRHLNLKYRGLDKTTDILSFPVLEGGPVLGEIFINLEAFEDLTSYQEILNLLGASSLKSKKQFRLLLDFILVHGLLHLIGYDDERPEEREQMLRLGKDFLVKHGIIKR
ncbi:MAG: rRNA maturation RNase YbeY [Patescibacteria group bacterium]|jgi:probable rRNA maturation factor|nr:rRNA maturation RNase YbeY [Patescibacteria group bacterium]MDD3435508.1 rRNA maturation RNase YbeY [Patescibacteria group bacterium]MDD4466726.1 rRNA maturation RNase YbeY [Patescibacteria group bacterium]